MNLNILKNLLYTALFLVVLASCHENKFRVIDLTIDAPEGDNIDYVGDGLQHPCMLLTNEDFVYIIEYLSVELIIHKIAFEWMTRIVIPLTQTTY